MKTKYNWSKVPKEVKWIATVNSGMVLGFYNEPIICDVMNTWRSSPIWDYTYINSQPIFHGKWQDSLEERPNVNEELEYYKTLCVEQELDIVRLKQGYSDLKGWIELNSNTIALEYNGYTTEEYVDADDLLDEINRIIGELK